MCAHLSIASKAVLKRYGDQLNRRGDDTAITNW